MTDNAPDAASESAAEPEEAAEQPARPGRDTRYRQQLRETQAERDALLQRVEAMQRNEVQRLVADRLADPNDLWRESELSDLLDDAGNIDTAKLDDRVGGLLEEHPHWGIEQPKSAKRGGLKSGASAPAPPRKDPWRAAFGPRPRD